LAGEDEDMGADEEVKEKKKSEGDDEDGKKSNKKAPSLGNGGTNEKYSWT